MEDFVPFEIAKKLKEKGFDYPCIGHYVNNQLYVAHYQNAFHSSKDESLDAPTISQVLKWLREEKKIFVVIAVNPTLATKDKMAYYYKVYSNSDGIISDYYESEEGYTQWEDCAIDSIKHILDNLI